MSPIPSAGPDALPEIPQKCRQIVAVRARGRRAAVRLWQRRGERWHPRGRPCYGYIGRAGLTARKREGDGATPMGLYTLGPAFGLAPKPPARMPYRAITPGSFWVDDPLSPQYNQWIEKSGSQTWKSAERLMDFPKEYELALVVGYNTRSRVPYRGSAIFLHVGDKPTAGCVALPRPALMRLLRRLSPAAYPHILITAGPFSLRRRF